MISKAALNIAKMIKKFQLSKESYHWGLWLETFRSLKKDDYETKAFPKPRSARAWTRVILAGKRDNRCHSTTGFSENFLVAEANYQMLEVLSFLQSWEILTYFNKNNRVNFSGKKGQ